MCASRARACAYSSGLRPRTATSFGASVRSCPNSSSISPAGRDAPPGRPAAELARTLALLLHDDRAGALPAQHVHGDVAPVPRERKLDARIADGKIADAHVGHG